MKQYWQFMPYIILKDTNQLSETKQFVSVIFYGTIRCFLWLNECKFLGTTGCLMKKKLRTKWEKQKATELPDDLVHYQINFISNKKVTLTFKFWPKNPKKYQKYVVPSKLLEILTKNWKLPFFYFFHLICLNCYLVFVLNNQKWHWNAFMQL